MTRFERFLEWSVYVFFLWVKVSLIVLVFSLGIGVAVIFALWPILLIPEVGWWSVPILLLGYPPSLSMAWILIGVTGDLANDLLFEMRFS